MVTKTTYSPTCTDPNLVLITILQQCRRAAVQHEYYHAACARVDTQLLPLCKHGHYMYHRMHRPRTPTYIPQQRGHAANVVDAVITFPLLSLLNPKTDQNTPTSLLY